MEQLELIVAKDAAKLLGISRASLCRLVGKNRIGVYRIGSRTMFDKDIINSFKESVYVKPSYTNQGIKEKTNENQ